MTDRSSSLRGDRGEPLLGYQAPGDLGSVLVEVMGAMGGLAEQNKLGISDEVEQRLVVAFGPIERVDQGAQIWCGHARSTRND